MSFLNCRALWAAITRKMTVWATRSPPPFATITNRWGRAMRFLTTAEGQAVALADKIDSLAGFWSIDEKPTGSKDPFALRRAALGIIRILLETETRLLL